MGDQIELEQKLKVEHLQQTSNSTDSIQQLQRMISDKDDERNLIRQRLEEIELELRKIRDENEKLLQHRETLREEIRECKEK